MPISSSCFSTTIVNVTTSSSMMSTSSMAWAILTQSSVIREDIMDGAFLVVDVGADELVAGDDERATAHLGAALVDGEIVDDAGRHDDVDFVGWRRVERDLVELGDEVYGRCCRRCRHRRGVGGDNDRGVDSRRVDGVVDDRQPVEHLAAAPGGRQHGEGACDGE